jgi:hypothetical protein
MNRLDEFLRMASSRMNRRQAGVAGAMLLALAAGADPASAHERHRPSRRGRRRPGQGAGRRRRCGGIAGIPCPAGLTCVDDPRDDCDPRAGGADCIGICVRKVKDPCATIRCRQGTKCCPKCGGICIPDDIRCSNDLCVSEPCNQAVCGPGEYCCNESCSRCVGLGQGCTQEICPPTGEPCGGNRCGPGEYCCNPSCGVCAPLGGSCATVVCDPEPGEMCGGIAGIPCPDGFVCVDDPRDDCDPAAGGADCPGICVPSGENPCAAILCRAGTTCCSHCGGICIPPGVPCSADLCVGEPCNQVVCGPGEFCCNESCSICAPRGGGCTDQFCGSPGQGVPCGPAICPVGQVCCNESCGICTPPGGACPALFCEPPGRGEPCGPTVCPVGQVCCNESCGICTPPGGGCILMVCVD